MDWRAPRYVAVATHIPGFLTASPTTSRAAPIITASTFATKLGEPGRMVTPLCLSLFCCLSNCIASPIAVFPGPYQRETQQRNQ